MAGLVDGPAWLHMRRACTPFGTHPRSRRPTAGHVCPHPYCSCAPGQYVQESPRRAPCELLEELQAMGDALRLTGGNAQWSSVFRRTRQLHWQMTAGETNQVARTTMRR